MIKKMRMSSDTSSLIKGHEQVSSQTSRPSSTPPPSQQQQSKCANIVALENDFQEPLRWLKI